MYTVYLLILSLAFFCLFVMIMASRSSRSFISASISSTRLDRYGVSWWYVNARSPHRMISPHLIRLGPLILWQKLMRHG